jgi:hypothetical protein
MSQALVKCASVVRKPTRGKRLESSVGSLLLFAATTCLAYGCRCGSDRKEPTREGSASASASAAPPEPEPVSRRTLAEREKPNTDALSAARGQVLEALKQARALAQAKKGAEALSIVTQARSVDPLGAVLALEGARAADLAGDAQQAAAWARLALASAPPNAVADAARGVLDKAGPAAPAAGEVGAFESIQAACAALEQRLRAEKPPPAGLGPVANAKCEVEYELELDGANLDKAIALRVTGGEGTPVVAWVGLHTPAGFRIYGPVDAAVSSRDYGLTNDFTVDLQKVDVLPGGGPEVVVKLDERRTLADVVMNELVELDRTRVFILSLDRGSLEASREFVLSESVRRRLIAAKDKRLPAGYKQSQELGGEQSFSMAVAWTGSNEITLTKASGTGEPRDNGRIVLFP